MSGTTKNVARSEAFVLYTMNCLKRLPNHVHPSPKTKDFKKRYPKLPNRGKALALTPFDW